MIRLIEAVTLTLKVRAIIPWAQNLDSIRRRKHIAEPKLFHFLSMYAMLPAVSSSCFCTRMLCTPEPRARINPAFFEVFYHNDRIKDAIRLGSRHLYLLSHLTGHQQVFM